MKYIIFLLTLITVININADIKGVTFSLASGTDSLMNLTENVITSLPVNSLIFKRENDSLFNANISTQYTFLDKSDSPITTSYLDTVISVSSYNETKNTGIIDIMRNFRIDSTYNSVSIRVYDLNSTNISTFSSRLIMPESSDRNAFIKSIEETGNNSWHFENSEKMEFIVHYYVKNPEKYILNTIIRDNSFVYTTRKLPLIESGTDTVRLSAELEVGKYVFIAELIENSVKVSSSSREFFIDFTFIYSDKAYNDIINALGYVAKGNEVKLLRQAKPDEREKKWNDFWLRAKDNPVLSGNLTYYEFMNRYKYANDQYSVHNKAGYKTDFGRIFIQYGKPDQIERFPFDIDSKPYEIWYYYSYGYEFIFMDVHGYGEYLLQNFYDQVR